MSIKTISLRDFSGGIAVNSDKKDIPFSARFVKNLNPFEDPTYITLSKKATKVSGETVKSLVYWMEDGSPYDTNEYFYDLTGRIYRETSDGTWSELRDTASAGEGLKIFDDYLYYMFGTDIGRYGRLSGTPAFDDSLTSWWDGAISDIQTTGGGTGAADYVPPTTISEVATARQTFTTTHDPIKEITIDVDVKGTGNWTVTLHDSENNSIGSKTIANALVSVADITFTFATALRVVIGNEYHFHVTSTVANGGVDTSAATDLEGAEFVVEYGVLIDTDFHPSVTVEDKMIVGNMDYLAVFDQSTYNPNKILLDRGFEIRSITKNDEFVVVSCYRGATVDTAEESRIFYWDTISPSWNYFTDSTSIGVGNAITNAGNVLRGIYGNRGALYEGDRPFSKEFTKTPKLARGKKVNVYPSAITNHNDITLIGIGTTDDGSGLEQGIYAFGSQGKGLNQVLVLLHTISTGTTQGTTLEIGFVKMIGENLYFSWRDDTAYGVDKIAPDALAVASGVYESLILDNSRVIKQKLAISLKGTFEALKTGESVTLSHKIDRTADFTEGDAVSTEDETKAELSIYSRYKEIEMKFELASSEGTFPKFTELSINFNDLANELIE